MKIELLSKTDNAWQVIERAAKVSTKKDLSKSPLEFCINIAKRGHWSPFEHAFASFRISMISRVLTHQLVRHRYISIVQESQRYNKITEAFFILPEKIQDKKTKELLKKILIHYNNLLKAGVKAEDARYILPSGIDTKIIATANFRAWIEFCKKRTDLHAQAEIRMLANSISEKLNLKEFLK